ncbi:cell division protein SepF [Actinoplanes missouriensis]|uniref:cell division protein SepF n=1 Tax=Actinoplanes missouriensis TaxID=1866 RepID=UPI000A03CDD5
MLNSYEVGRGAPDGIRLTDNFRCLPHDYEDAVRRIAQNYCAAHVVSVDLSKVDHQSAIRIVEFCSGLCTARSGWMFRVSEFVIVLTPGVD